MPAIADLSAATQRQVVARIMEIKTELQSLRDKVADQSVTPKEVEQIDALKGELTQLRNHNDTAFAKAGSIGEILKDADAYLNRPVGQMPHAGSGGGGEAKRDDKGVEIKGNRIDAGESEIDRLLPTGGFKTAGHFYKAIQLQSVGRYEEWAYEGLKRWDDVRKKTAMTTLEDPSAGVLVPEGFTAQIEKRMDVTENLMRRARVLPIQGSSMSFVRRQDASRADGSRHAGVSVAYEGETHTYDKTKAKYEKYRIEADKVACLIEVTEELLEDSPMAIEAEISDLASDAIVFKVSDMMIRGTGAGTPLGILNSGHTVTVTPETGQTAGTLEVDNIFKMWMRLDPACRANAIWMINNDVSAALDAMAFPVGTGGVPAYLPAGGLSTTGYASLKGRPVIPMEYCESLNTVGDIILADWSYYQGVTKGGIRSDMSIHVYFERDARCFRFVHRFGGQPRWNVPFTPYKGSTTTSAFVVLGTRS
jgi:HK97 family phage major capsid protein